MEIERAFWLTDNERKGLLANLNPQHPTQLTRILCSLLYAEKCFRSHCKKSSIFLENILIKMGLHHHFCSTIGIWNFNVSHASRFGYTKKEFKKLLLDEVSSTGIVIRHIVEHLGLHKSPEHIFAEYNHNPMATVVVAVQRCLNTTLGSELLEDGLLGQQTLGILQKRFPTSSFDEPALLKILSYFSKEHGVHIEPFVPQVIVKRDLRYALNLRHLPRIFHNHIDVPAYVGWGMEAYNRLTT